MIFRLNPLVFSGHYLEVKGHRLDSSADRLGQFGSDGHDGLWYHKAHSRRRGSLGLVVKQRREVMIQRLSVEVEGQDKLQGVLN